MSHYAITDMGCAAFLYARGHTLTVVELSPGRRQFQFPPEAEQDAPGYYQGEPLPARAFYAALRDVKNMLHGPVTRQVNSNSGVRNAQSTPTKR